MDIFLVEDSSAIRRLLARRLEDMAGVRVVGEADSAPQAIALIDWLQPDTVLLDMTLLVGTGVDVLRALRHKGFQGRILMLTHHAMDAYRDMCMQAGADGFYDSQKGDAMNLRGVFRTDAKGGFHFRCVKPTHYPVPHDGPVGRMLTATGRHPMRPPHLHFWITAPGYKPLITHLFVKGGKYLDSDAVFGVKPELIVDFRKGKDGLTRVHYDFVLMPAARGRPKSRGGRRRT